LGHVAWVGNVYRFSDPESITSLARYLSSDWLTTTQINQQLDLLCWRIQHQHIPGRKHEIVNTHFFPKIIQLFQQNQVHLTYTAESPPSDGHYPWAVGQDLADTTSGTTIVSGVFNVSNSHWVSMTVDVERRTISYGDSLVSDRKVKEVVMRAVKWWIAVHIKNDFVHVDLPITCQTDSFSCGVFAVNSIQHLAFPQEGLFLPHGAITERYRWFLGVFTRHNELVGFFLLCSVCSHLHTLQVAPNNELAPNSHKSLLTFKAVPQDGGFVFERTILASVPTHIPINSGWVSTTADFVAPNDSLHLKPALPSMSTPNPINSGSVPATAELVSTYDSPHLSLNFASMPPIPIDSGFVPSTAKLGSPNNSSHVGPTPVQQKRPRNDHTGLTSSISKRQKKLDTWFTPGTINDVVAYRQRTHLEWSEKDDDIQHQEKRNREENQRHKRENATERKRKQRAKEVVEDIQAGRRNNLGQMIKTKPPKVCFVILLQCWCFFFFFFCCCCDL
jgi:hypothetical protein